MRSLVALTLVPAAIALGVGLVSCVGDEPSTVSPSPGVPDGSASDGSSSGGDASSSGTNGCAGDTIDACGPSCTKCVSPMGGAAACTNGACEKTCAAPAKLCGDACIDTTRSEGHCGTCDHSCNGASCSAGACQPLEIAGGFTQVKSIDISSMGVVMIVDNGTSEDVKRCGVATGCTAATLSDVSTGGNQLERIAVSGTNVYWTTAPSDPWIVYRCPLTGCPGTGPNEIENTNDRIGALVAGPNDLYWALDNGYYGPHSKRCTLPACSSKQVVRVRGNTEYENLVDPSVNPSRERQRPSKVVSAGKTTVLWDTGSLYNSNVRRLRSCPLASQCTAPTEVNTDGAAVSALTYFNDRHYGASGANSGNVIFSVADVAGTTTRTVLVPDAAGIADVAVDASGIYWVNATTGNVRRCAKLTGCDAGSVETLATGQTGATAIRVDAANVYWALPTKVMRVVKP